MTSTPVQFTDKQYEVSEKAMLQDGIRYFSEHVRNALDFYHEEKYPQLLKQEFMKGVLAKMKAVVMNFEGAIRGAAARRQRLPYDGFF